MRLMMGEVFRHPTDATEDQCGESGPVLTSSPTLAKTPRREKKRDRQTGLRFVFLGFFFLYLGVKMYNKSGAHDWIHAVQAGCKISGAISSWADDLFRAYLHAWTIYLLLKSREGLFSISLLQMPSGFGCGTGGSQHQLESQAKLQAKECFVFFSFSVYYTHL